MIHREMTRSINVGKVKIGGSNTIIIQSMCNTLTKDTDATIKQIIELQNAGCEIVRIAVLDEQDAYAIKQIKQHINIPLVADIHFDYKLALLAIENGIDKIRINPGNIGTIDRVKAVVDACKEKKIPIRIGVNSGSLENDILDIYTYPCAKAMIASAKKHVALLESLEFHDICISLKSSNTLMAIEAYELAAQEFSYPLHLGITEAGTKFAGTIKSAVGLSPLIYQGIGSTLRISLSTNPVEEIKVAQEILKNFNLANNVPTIVSCPTCGRLQYNMFEVVDAIEEYLKDIKSNIHVAIMGCVVNGPGEAKQATLGIAGGNGKAILFKKGIVIKTIAEKDMIVELKAAIDEYLIEESNV